MKIKFKISVAVCLFYICGCSFNYSPEQREKINEEKQALGFTQKENPRLKEVQFILKDNGFNPGRTDGIFSLQTRKAIKDFQEFHQLDSSGYVDAKTLLTMQRFQKIGKGELKPASQQKIILPAKLDKDVSMLVVSPAPAAVIPPPPPEDHPKDFLILKNHNKPHFEIIKIQMALKIAGYDPGAIDGKMGKKTILALMSFQQAKHLNADGKIGPKTWQALSRYLPKE